MSDDPVRSHVPVLMDEVLGGLAPGAGETLLDCTAGLGGHAAAIAPALGSSGRIILIDADPDNLSRAATRIRALPDAPTVIDIHANFGFVDALLRRDGHCVDMVLADLGVASSQLDDPARGLSFSRDGPLDMRLDPGSVGTAADLVNGLPERRLSDLIYQMGEEPLARRIAARIVDARRGAAITTTAQLAALVRDAYGSRAARSRLHPATRTFMALRIAVNDELGALERLLESIERSAAKPGETGGSFLAAGARVAIISFHSLEDRLVKHAFRDLERRGLAEESAKGPIVPSDEECARNPRARSAKLRVLRLVGRC